MWWNPAGMPVRSNPRDSKRCWYPDGCNAFHATRKPSAFDQVWESGALLAADYRPSGTTHVQEIDLLAGDGEYVFLTLGQPFSEYNACYTFVFDALMLVEGEDALLGLADLLRGYEHASSYILDTFEEEHPAALSTGLEVWARAERVLADYKDEFLEEIEPLQAALRLQGGDAVDWLLEKCESGGDLDPNKAGTPPDVFFRHRDAKRVLKQYGMYSYVDANEILVPERLSLDNPAFRGVVFEGIYFSEADLADFFDIEVGEPLPIKNISRQRKIEARHRQPSDTFYSWPTDLPDDSGTRRYGFPCRCPLCDQQVVRGDFDTVIAGNPWWRVVIEDDTVSIANGAPGMRAGEVTPIIQCESCERFFVDVGHESFGSGRSEKQIAEVFVRRVAQPHELVGTLVSPLKRKI